jgi:hypothetical protein
MAACAIGGATSLAVWNFGAEIVHCDVRMSVRLLLQANAGTKENFYVVAVMESGRMRMYWSDNDKLNTPWAEGEEFGRDVCDTPPVMIESNHGTHNENGVGDFELPRRRRGSRGTLATNQYES